MYIVDALGGQKPNLPDRPLVISSLSQPTTLEQWHCRLSHCNTSTIEEMAGKGLVDGLTITEKDLRGKCKDCILGRQTRRPFDEKMDTSLDPLDLVSFDLWG